MSGDLVAFLRAQVDEDEAAAKALAPYWLAIFSHAIQPHAQRLARHDPARVLREVEAGRKLLAEYEAATAAYRRALDAHARELKDRSATLAKLDIAAAVMQAWQQAVRLKAAVYRDHPDYRQEWAP